MSRRKQANYIILQEYMPLREQRRLAKAIVRSLPFVTPSPKFVRQLQQDLLVEAAQHLQSRTVVQQTLRTAGVIGGGALSILGVVLLLNLRNHQGTDPAHIAA